MAFLVLIGGCSTAKDRAADAEYHRAVMQMHDRSIETGDITEIADATRICFLAEPGSDELRGYARAVSEGELPDVTVEYGSTVSDCPNANLFVTFEQQRKRGVLFRMNRRKMRNLGENKADSAYEVGRNLLEALRAIRMPKRRAAGK